MRADIDFRSGAIPMPTLRLPPLSLTQLSITAAAVAAIIRMGAAAVVALSFLATAALPQTSRPPERTAEAAGDAMHRERAELIAARLLASAKQDVAEGRTEVARRVLEALVARYPLTEAATEARRRLLHETNASVWQPPQRHGERTMPHVSPPAASDPLPPQRLAAPSPELAGRSSTSGDRDLQDELRQIIGDRVFFSAGSTALGSRARALITAQASWLQRRPHLVVVVAGHADDASVGGDDDALSERRAANVRDRLLEEGVASERIEIVAHGARDPVAVCSDSDCAAQNRRTVLHVRVLRSLPAGLQGSQVPAARTGASTGASIGAPAPQLQR